MTNEIPPEPGSPTGPGPGQPPGQGPGPAAAFNAGQGLNWFSDALSLLRMQLFRLLLLGLVLQLLGGFSQAGVLGLVFVIIAPALAAGMLQALHETAAGERPSVLALFSAFRQPGRLPGLLMLGLLTVVVAIATVAFVLGGSMGSLDPQLVARLEAGDATAVNDIDPQLIMRAMMGLAFGVLVGAALGFFAVPLMWFFGLPPGRALWLGVASMLRQWRALLVMGLMLALLGVPVATAAGMALAAQAASGNPSTILTLFMLVSLVAYQLLAFASQYVAFRAVFGGPQGPSQLPPREPGSDQLVA
jgi:hypothetical protein